MFDPQQTCAAAYTVAVDGDDFRFSSVNEACLAMAGLTIGFHAGLRPHDCFPEFVASEIVKRYRTCRDTRQAISYLSETGPGRRWRTTLFPILGPGGDVEGLAGICAELSDDLDATVTLETRHEMATLALGAIEGGFWVYEIASGSFETSRQLAEFVAGPGTQPLGLAEYASHVHAEDLATKNVLDPRGADDRSCADYRVVTFEGRTRWLRSRRRLIRDATGAPVRVVGVVSDITEQKKHVLALESEASTDPLTSLKNRRAFDRAARLAVEAARGTQQKTGLLLIDLDNFKPVNDRFGHQSGDLVLRKVARRLCRHVRKSDLVARIGGDEFAMLLHDTSLRRATTLAARISVAFEKDFAFDEQAVQIGVSIGAAVSIDGDEGYAKLLERADRALYANKREGKKLIA